MSRRLLTAAMLCAIVTTSAACSGSSGTHTQSNSRTSPSAPTTTDTPTSTPPTSGRTSPPSSSSKPSKPTNVSVPTPTVAPAAQGAVNAYIGLYNLTSNLGLDPAHADTSKIAPYVTAATLPQWRGIFTTMAQHGLAYRGIPDNPHVKVVSASGQSAVLSSCPTPNAHDPYIQYVVATGKPVQTTTDAHLHPKAITVLHASGRWRVASVIPDEGRTCKP